jgi:uncharacterized protein YdaT
MATAPITSTAARDFAFAARNEEVKSFAPKNKVSENEVNFTKIETQTENVSATNNVQEAEQAQKAVEETKPAAVVNTRGEVTGSRINTSA